MNNKKINVEKVVKICKAELINGDKSLEINSYSKDSRNINTGDMYIAIKGERINGNDYIEDAFNKGAIGCISDEDIDKRIIDKFKNKIIIKVQDTIKAIQEIAKYKRSLYDIPVIAVTGSVGKTSTKDIIASVVSQKFDVLKTEGNMNNHIGLPLTLLKLKDHTAVVVEMGMNHFGEISLLTSITKPTICVITNIGTAHIGNLGSRENILKSKLEILEGLKEKGAVVINNDNDLLNKWGNENKKYNIHKYGIKNESNYIAQNIIEKENESKFVVNNVEVNVPVGGEHFIYNALCAFSVGKLLNIEESKIVNGINKFSLTSKRMDIQKIKNNITVVNDSYNASLDSMKAVLEVVSKMQGKRKIAVLGNMLELGSYAEELHRKVGEYVAKNKLDVLITVGKYAKFIAEEAKKLNLENVFIFENIEEASNVLLKIMQNGDIILLKASNSMNFSKILDLIK